MDFYKLSKAYQQYIRDPERPIFPDCYEGKNKHRQRIIGLSNSLARTKESFCQTMAHIKYTLQGRLNACRRLIDDPVLGGHYEVYTDDYDDRLHEMEAEIAKAERLYSLIAMDQEDIAQQYRLIEQEKDAAILRKLNVKRTRNSASYPTHPGLQRSLF